MRYLNPLRVKLLNIFSSISLVRWRHGNLPFAVSGKCWYTWRIIIIIIIIITISTGLTAKRKNVRSIAALFFSNNILGAWKWTFSFPRWWKQESGWNVAVVQGNFETCRLECFVWMSYFWCSSMGMWSIYAWIPTYRHDLLKFCAQWACGLVRNAASTKVKTWRRV